MKRKRNRAVSLNEFKLGKTAKTVQNIKLVFGQLMKID
jgi:hypothetical protein